MIVFSLGISFKGIGLNNIRYTGEHLDVKHDTDDVIHELHKDLWKYGYREKQPKDKLLDYISSKSWKKTDLLKHIEDIEFREIVDKDFKHHLTLRYVDVDYEELTEVELLHASMNLWYYPCLDMTLFTTLDYNTENRFLHSYKEGKVLSLDEMLKQMNKEGEE